MIGWLDCASGCSGDMLLGALLDAGVEPDAITASVSAVAPEGIEITTERVLRAGFGATSARVHVAESTIDRTWSDVRAMLERAPLPPTVHARALSTFARLAEAEGNVHAHRPDDVHFHEVGGLDAIADIVGVCAGFDHLGLTELHASPVALGSGNVRSAHGVLAVPAPAVVELLRGVPTYGGPVGVELCTPTGAALLLEWVSSWGVQPPMTTSAVGVGAGGRDLDDHANVVRLLVGEPPAAPGRPAGIPVLIESNVDDLDPRLWPGVLAALLDAGASDAWLTPILMKKGRPAHTLSVLVTDARSDAVRDVIFAETSTIGLRETAVDKRELERQQVTVDVAGRPVRVKLAVHLGRVVNAQPEYDDVAAAAATTGQPTKSVLARAVAEASKLW